MKTTVVIKGIEFEVEFDFQPYEKPQYYDSNGLGHPGCEAEVSHIGNIMHGDTNFDFFFRDDMDIVEEAIWNSLRCDYEPYEP
jgi:hypothetical protein